MTATDTPATAGATIKNFPHANDCDGCFAEMLKARGLRGEIDLTLYMIARRRH